MWCGCRFMEPLLSNVPTVMVAGDREMEPQAEDYAFAAFTYRFAFPFDENNPSLSSLYYSFNAGGIHFVVISAYIPYDKSCKLSCPFPFFLSRM